MLCNDRPADARYTGINKGAEQKNDRSALLINVL